MRILVTGAAGFIGNHLCNEFHKYGHQLHGADLTHGDDLRRPLTIRGRLDVVKPDICVHLAAKVGRLFGEDDLGATIEDNATMTANVARACGERGVKLVYASTSEVYGDNAYDFCDEDDGPFSLPHNLYGLSKRWGEEVCRLYAPDNLLIWRISMPYGPGLPAGRGRAALINFLYNARHRLPITVHQGSERSWCWIGDTVRAMRLTIETSQTGAWNLGRDDNSTSMMQVARRACDLTGAPYGLIAEVEPPERQTVVKRLSTLKLKGLGWKPEVELDEGMKRTLDWVDTLAPPAEQIAA